MPKTKLATPPPSSAADEEIEIPQEQGIEPDPEDFEQWRKTLTPQKLSRGKVYLYRQRPIVKSKSKTKYIAVYDLRAFSLQDIEDDHKGGKYKLDIDIGDEQRHVFYHEVPGPAFIDGNEFIVVDGNGNPVATVPIAAQATAPATKEDLSQVASVVKEAVNASRVGNDGAQSALAGAVTLLTTASGKALEIVADAKSRAGGDDSALRRELQELRAEMRSDREQRLEQKVKELEERLDSRNNSAPAGELGAIAHTANVLGIEGGLTGLLRAVFVPGSATPGVEQEPGGMGDYFMRRVADGVGDFIKSIPGPRVMDFLERGQLMRFQQQQASGPAPGPQPQTPAAAPQIQPPAIVSVPAISPGPQPQNQQDIEMQQIIETLKAGIPVDIRYFWEHGFNGAGVAIILKQKYAPWLPMIRLQFNKLDELMKLARETPILQPMTVDRMASEDEEAYSFTSWAQEFFDEFHTDEPQPADLPGSTQAAAAGSGETGGKP